MKGRENQEHNIVLPRLVVSKIMGVLSVRDILNMGAVCKRFHTLLENELLWKYLVERDFGITTKQSIVDDDTSWFTIYKEEYYCVMRLLSLKVSYNDIFTQIR